MIQYKNLNGTSNIDSYEIGNDFIDVCFKDRWAYRYTRQIPGIAKVLRMQELATQGFGLNSYIDTEIGRNYLSKWQI